MDLCERLFLAEFVGSDPTADFENRKVGSGCVYKRFDFSLFRRLISIRFMLTQACTFVLSYEV